MNPTPLHHSLTKNIDSERPQTHKVGFCFLVQLGNSHFWIPFHYSCLLVPFSSPKRGSLLKVLDYIFLQTKMKPNHHLNIYSNITKSHSASACSCSLYLFRCVFLYGTPLGVPFMIMILIFFIF